jgi:ribonuclease G
VATAGRTMATSKMLVEENAHESRVAVLEDDRLVELYLERSAERGTVGSIYKGKVHRVLPGMQAAFVDIGLERDAFLYVSDVLEEAADLEELELAEELPGEPGPGAIAERPPSISDLLRVGQEVLVQVAKDPLPSKGARVTTRITLPGRYLVYLPNGSHRGVSRRIDSEEERARLRGLVSAFPIGGGLIVRTAGEGKDSQDFEQDAEVLARRWQAIRERAQVASAPTCLHRDLDLVLRVVRDVFGPGFAGLWVEGEAVHERIVDFLQEVQPSLLAKVHHSRGAALFDAHGVDEAVAEALRPKVWLKSGGYLVIHPTEALVAIDVNTGRFVGRQSLDETILHTNLEAVGEIVRQIRLRNLGGILVLDLIDMVVPEHRQQVFEALERELRRDRAKNKVLSISEFGLVELTRKRGRPSLERLLTRPCPYCDARGRVKSAATVVLELRRQLLRQGFRPGTRMLQVRLHPEVAAALTGEEREVLEELERTLGVAVEVRADADLHRERFEVTSD